MEQEFYSKWDTKNMASNRKRESEEHIYITEYQEYIRYH